MHVSASDMTSLAFATTTTTTTFSSIILTSLLSSFRIFNSPHRPETTATIFVARRSYACSHDYLQTQRNSTTHGSRPIRLTIQSALDWCLLLNEVLLLVPRLLAITMNVQAGPPPSTPSRSSLPSSAAISRHQQDQIEASEPPSPPDLASLSGGHVLAMVRRRRAPDTCHPPQVPIFTFFPLAPWSLD